MEDTDNKTKQLYKELKIAQKRISELEAELTNRQPENSLSETEERYRRLVEYNPAAIAIHTDGIIKYVNAAGVKLIGAQHKEQILGRSVFDFIVPQRKDILTERLKNAQLDTEYHSSYNENLIRLDGEIITVDITGIGTTFEGKPAIQAVLWDVTRYKQNEESLRQAKEYSENIINSSLDMIISVDADRKITEFNHAAEKVFGYSKSEVLGKHVNILYADPNQSVLIHETTAKKLGFEGEILNRRKNGETFITYLSSSELRDNTGAVIGYMGISRDITERKKVQDELNRAHSVTKTILQKLPFGIIIVDKKRNIKEINQAALQMMGVDSSDKITGRICHNVICPAERDKCPIYDLHETVNKSERILIGKNGKRIPVLKAVIPINLDGEDVLLETFIDISDLKRTEEALRESEKRFRDMTDLLPQTIFELDMNGIFTFINRYGIETMGFTDEELKKGANGLSIFSPIERQRIEENIRKRLRGEDFDDHEYTITRKDGTTYPALIYSNVITHDNKPAGVRGIVLDVSDIKKAEEELKLLSTGIDQAYDSVVITDREGTIQYVNPVFEKITGYSREEAIGQNPRILKSSKQTKDFYNKLWKTILSGKVWQGEFINRRKNGKLFYEEASIAPIKNNEEITHFVAIKRDITEKKNLEKNISRLRREHEAFMRHEMKNILSPIRGYSDLLLLTSEEKLDEEEKMYLSEISKATTLAVNLIDNLKKLQDIEAGKFILTKCKSSLQIFIEQGLKNTQVLADELGVNVEFDNKLSDSDIIMDVNLMPGVFTNLIKNAVEHVGKLRDKSEKIVKIAMYGENNKIIITINNKGKPIPPEKLELFFDKFNTDRFDKKEGTGLGTTYAYLVVKAHGGDILVESNEKDGTTITIQFLIENVK